MIYFDNAATTLPKPAAVKQAVWNSMDILGNPARGAHTPAMLAARMQLQAREVIAGYMGAQGAQYVAFAANATAALNMVIRSLKGHIITTQAEHNSVLRPIYASGSSYTIVPVTKQGVLDYTQLEKAITPATTAIVAGHGSNVSGNINDINRLGQICKAHNLHFVVDAAQTAGLIPIDMKRYNIAAVCFSGHKSLYGPQGIGAVCLSPGFEPKPLLAGGSGFDTFNTSHPLEMPTCFEAGTPNMPGIAGLLAGVEYVQAQAGACYKIAAQLADIFANGVRKLNAYQLYGDFSQPNRLPVVSLTHSTAASGEIADMLQQNYAIAVRSGYHCAPLIHDALGTKAGGVVRFSFSHFNTEAEVQVALQALAEIAEGLAT